MAEDVPAEEAPQEESPAAPDPAPTYVVLDQGDHEIYMCLIPDASHATGRCDHWSPTYELIAQHMQQRHNAMLIEAPEGYEPPGGTPSVQPAEAGESMPAPPPPPPEVPMASQRTAESQEHPPQTPPPAPQ